jgi:polysaccharide biosynthesis protein PslG
VRVPRWSLLLAPLLLLLVPTAPLFAARGPYQAASPEYGLSAFVYDRAATTDRDLNRVQALGFGWVKLLFRWTDLEHDYKGAFTWSESDRVVRAANAAGLKIVARLDFQPWWARADRDRNGPPDNPRDLADFVYAFVSRYGEGSSIGRVQAVEIWNEPNLTREWGHQLITRQSAADYAQLLRLASRAAHGADPGVTVISAGLSPTNSNDPACCAPDDQYLQWLYDAGFKDSFDVLGANANVQCPCVDAAPGSLAAFNQPSFYFRRVEQLRQIMVANGDGDKQIWLMEFGWTTDQTNPSYSWFATTEERKAELIVQAYRYAHQNWAPWIGLMTLWTLPDPTWEPTDERVSWAISNLDGSRRPAYDRLLWARRNGELP